MDNQLQNQQNSIEPQDESVPKLTPKLQHFLELVTDKSNAKTYGNMTESAMQAYDCKNRVSAATLGHKAYRKVKTLGLAYADDRGHTLGKMIDVAMAKLYDSKNGGGIEWWREVMEITGLKEPAGAKIVINNSNQTNNVDINDPAAIDYNKKFKQFLMNE